MKSLLVAAILLPVGFGPSAVRAGDKHSPPPPTSTGMRTAPVGGYVAMDGSYVAPRVLSGAESAKLIQVRNWVHVVFPWSNRVTRR